MTLPRQSALDDEVGSARPEGVAEPHRAMTGRALRTLVMTLVPRIARLRYAQDRKQGLRRIPPAPRCPVEIEELFACLVDRLSAPACALASCDCRRGGIRSHPVGCRSRCARCCGSPRTRPAIADRCDHGARTRRSEDARACIRATAAPNGQRMWWPSGRRLRRFGLRVPATASRCGTAGVWLAQIHRFPTGVPEPSGLHLSLILVVAEIKSFLRLS